MTTYRRADGDTIGDFAWVAGLEMFEDDDGPTEVVEEVWQCVSRTQHWILPTRLYDCDVDWCDEDAVAWVEQAPGNWSQRCEEHRAFEIAVAGSEVQ